MCGKKHMWISNKIFRCLVVNTTELFILYLLYYKPSLLLLVIMAAPSNLVTNRVPKIRVLGTCEVNRKINFWMLNIEHFLSMMFQSFSVPSEHFPMKNYQICQKFGKKKNCWKALRTFEKLKSASNLFFP